MRIPLSWLKEYIQIDLTPEEIAKKLTMAGLEVEGYETSRLNFEGVVVGFVSEVERHPNADKLCVAKVSDGKETYQVVCGAPNCRQGMKTAFAPEGAILKEEEGKEFKIKRTKLRGVESFGMLCSGKELGISADGDGILELPSNLKEGIPLDDLYADTIFEVSLTPNLSHCTSVIGIARELSAMTGAPLHEPPSIVDEEVEAIKDNVALTVLDSEGCSRYSCRLIKDVKVSPSPDWLRHRLEQCGLRSVNNIVDMTNYVLLEMGHPLHAFDYDRLERNEIIVKKAEKGERFTTLDGKERILTENDLMICDAHRSVAIAGVMGGLESEVSDQTRNILIESAYFDPITIRRTSKRLGLQTDASKRFERGTDPNGIEDALNRVTMLIQQMTGGRVCAGILEVSAKEFPQKVITCRLSRVNQLLGITISRGELESVFQRLHFNCHWEGDHLVVQVPTYRVDVQSEIDLIEEVARLYGYDHIPKKGGAFHSSEIPHAPIYLFEKDVQSRLIAEGLQEFLTCDLIGPSMIDIVQSQNMPSDSVVRVINPTSVEQSILRTSLLPGLLQVVKYNCDHQNHDISGFEIGRIHFKTGDQYKEQSVAAIILSGKNRPSHWEDKPRDYDFFDMKGIVENLLYELGIFNATFKNLNIPTFHTGRQVSVFVDSLEVGSFGEIHPAIQRRLDVTQRILFGEFNLHDLIQVVKSKGKVQPLAIYPSSERDWTLTIQNHVPFAKVLQTIKESGIPFLEEYSLQDIYRSEKLGHDVQNITLRFVYRDPNKTIEQEIVDQEHQKLMTEVLKKLGSAVKI